MIENYILTTLFFLFFIAIMVFSIREQIKQYALAKSGKQDAIELFKKFESELIAPVTEYTFYMSGHKSIWLETGYEAYKKQVMASYVVRSNDNSYRGMSFEYKLMHEERLVYIQHFLLGAKDEDFDWNGLLHYEEWVNTPSPIKAIIDKENAARRQRAKDAKWWQFWKFDNFT